MSVSAERQEILDLLEEVCRQAEAGELEFEYREYTVSEGVQRWIGDVGAINPGVVKRPWRCASNMLCPKVAPGLKIKTGTFIAGIWYDWRKSHGGATYGGGRDWGEWYLRALDGVPLGLTYRLNRALKPLVKQRLREEAQAQWEADAEARRIAREEHEQAVLKSLARGGESR